jgi:hypothetical protein
MHAARNVQMPNARDKRGALSTSAEPATSATRATSAKMREASGAKR